MEELEVRSSLRKQPVDFSKTVIVGGYMVILQARKGKTEVEQRMRFHERRELEERFVSQTEAFFKGVDKL